ncbi:uncharacterized protein LOC112597325 isoform X1 [Melanaphis sacchari]|uniref:uncharacterized protein LOC112597325 isoform X1 n=2 Tax=Melanaphis sacchari TaxID=742174 RepID=UPI000DC13041|nr:uncharacterized protein LOC112597325 isoform X1 [Melanaphis sacchari]XP_025199105.1 uncharacterized protein LOC112597325 isoform X1 [Melanaphis sacchari]
MESYESNDRAFISSFIDVVDPIDPVLANVNVRNISEPMMPTMPWPGIEKYFVCKGNRGNNFLVQCLLCKPSSKLLSVSKTSPSNLKRHIKKVHECKNNDFENDLNEQKQNATKKKRCFSLDTNQNESPLLNLTVERCMSERDVTQHKLDYLLLKFIINDIQPLSVVDNPSFSNLIKLGLPQDLKIMSSKTLKLKIEKLYLSMVDNITNTLSSVMYVSTTADCWTNGKNSYLAVTCHWINSKNFKRESVSLACCCLEGHHTYDVIVKALHKIYTMYKIQNKIVSTTTDNGSNFIELYGTNSIINLDNDITVLDNENKFVDLFDILNSTFTIKQEADIFIQLPLHYRCVSHTLNLIANSDIDKTINSNTSFKHLYSKILEKCSSIWLKQNISHPAVEKIWKTSRINFKTSNTTRWKRTYDVLLQMKNVLNEPNGLDKINQVLDCCEIQRFTPQEIQLINEYCDVMSPLADTLDFLQSEECVYMGYLLPSLYALEKKLRKFENGKLIYCEPLLQTIIESIKKRFESIWKKNELILASCLIPKFKLIWLNRYDQYLAEANLKALFDGTANAKNEISGADTTDSEFNITQDFFCLPSNKKPKSSSEDELQMYLNSPSNDISMLPYYPNVMKVFFEYNTPMPSSTHVKRLFSTGMSRTTVKRNDICDELFEKLILLKQNQIVLDII